MRLRTLRSLSPIFLVLAACGSDDTIGFLPDAGGHPDATATDAGTSDALAPDAGDAATSATVTLPQFIHGAARVDTTAFPTIPLVGDVAGAVADSVSVVVDTAAPIEAMSDAGKIVATVPVSSLAPGAHTITATASSAGKTLGTATGSLVVAASSFQFTQFASVGDGYDSHVALAPAGDELAFTWVASPTGSHQLFLQYLDGAMTRLLPADVVLNDAADEPVSGYTAISANGIGVVYHVLDPVTSHWHVKMRVVDPQGVEILAVKDLTGTDSAFALAQAGADPGGFSATWLDIQPTPDGGAPPPVQVRFARWDAHASTLAPSIVLDSDQPEASGSTQGPQTLEPLAEMGIACNAQICVVSYTRDVYNTEVQLNVPKLFLATVSLSTGQLVGTPQAVETTDWDTQLFGQSLVVQSDGSFVLVYTANDTAAAVNPITPCDSTEERDDLYEVMIDATGHASGAPAKIFYEQGSREYPRVAPHPDGYALFWEDQRSECDATNMHIGMAMNVAAPNLESLLDPYLEAPGSIGLPPEDPSLAVTGTSFVVAWSDDRHGGGIAMPEAELFFETYWRQ